MQEQAEKKVAWNKGTNTSTGTGRQAGISLGTGRGEHTPRHPSSQASGISTQLRALVQSSSRLSMMTNE